MTEYSFEIIYETSHKVREGGPSTSDAFKIEMERREVSLMAFESLVNKNLLEYVSFRGKRNVPKEYRIIRLHVGDVDAVLTSIAQGNETYPIAIRYWAKRLISAS